MRGLTLMELLVTIAVLALVMAMLAFPLFSAFGYIQKATARGEAQRAGAKAAREIARALGTATYVFELPPDGSWVTVLKGAEGDENISLAMPMEMDNTSNPATLIRFAQVPDFPWHEDANASTTAEIFVKFYPNYYANTAFAATLPIYNEIYAPFHDEGRQGMTPNPYIVARYQQEMPWSVAWESASAVALEGYYPMKDYTETTREMRTRRLRNDMVGITPYGDSWDAPRFQVVPLRQTTESLAILVDAQGHKNPTVFLSRYPLWAGRSRDLDDLRAAERTAIYGSALDEAWMRDHYPLNPKGVNPYGYQIRVFDERGGQVFGTNYAGYSATVRALPMSYERDDSGNKYLRHPMDWPPIDRPDFTDNNTGAALWDRDDIARQRMEGKVVFAQPMAPKVVTFAAGKVTLPVPNGAFWNAAKTYLVTPPQQLELRSQASGVKKSFHLVSKFSAAAGERAEEYLLVNPDKLGKDAASRAIEFGDTTLTGDWDVLSGLYYICDLQPHDVVVATYATKGVLDVTLTVSREDRAGRTPAQRRQDYTTNMRIEVRNAIKRARGSQ